MSTITCIRATSLVNQSRLESTAIPLLSQYSRKYGTEKLKIHDINFTLPKPIKEIVTILVKEIAKNFEVQFNFSY